MSSDTRRVPWSLPTPSVAARVIASVAIGLFAAALHYFKPGDNGGLSDFSLIWYGSKLLLHGQNPYVLIGPHLQIDLPSHLYYPAPALVAGIPFTLLPVGIAGAAFVFLSAGFLTYGITSDGWYRLPLLFSVSFFTAARLGQWSILFTAAVFLPILAVFAIAKPQASLPVLAGARTRSTFTFAVVGALFLVALSFLFLPTWVPDWAGRLSSAGYFRAPLMSVMGLPIAIVLLRWRRAEAWLVFISACVPQTWYPYNGLVLMAVASTYREASVLSLTSSVAWLIAYMALPGDSRSIETQAMFRGVLIAFCYMPAVIVVLRRPHDGYRPAWMPSAVNSIPPTSKN